MSDPQPHHVLPRTAVDPDAEAVAAPNGSQTWRQLEERARRIARALRDEGLDPHDAWGILARNRLEWVELSIGNGRAGTRYVPLNWHLTAPEVSELLVDSGSTLLIVDPASEAVGREAASMAGVERVIVFGPDYEEWVTSAGDAPLPDGPIGQPLQYTGGTTGRSKGVVRPDQAGKASEMAERYGMWGRLTGQPENGRAMLCTPAYHALGGALMRSVLARGHDIVVLEGWDPEQVLSTIEERGITTSAMVPTQFIRLLKLDPDVRDRYDVSSLRWILHTAAPCPRWAKEEMIGWFGPVLVELYGSSEGTGPVIATSEEWLERPGTVGRATSALTLSIVDQDGNDLPPGEVGTIYVDRFDGAPEYHGDPEKTAAMVLPDGRFTVGDIGWLDEDGFLYLADRRVDLIIRGGSNIYPAEIEGVLSQHPDVADVAVFGIPDPDLGQEVKAVVEPAPGHTVDAEDVRRFARERLASFKVPSTVDIVDALPREASGKLKKRLLREPYWEQTS